MDVGLHGNIFTRDFDTLGDLACHSWMKTTWQLCHRFRVEFTVHERYNVPLLRVGDKALMECFLSCGVFDQEEISTLGRVSKFKKVYSLGDILECDGRKVRLSTITKEEGYSMRRFSVERPRPVDIRLWERAIRHITSPALLLSPPLGTFLREPHVYSPWFASTDKAELYRESVEGSYDMFRKNVSA